MHSPSNANCNDGDACTVGDVCVGGDCKAGIAKQCADGNPCTDDGCESGSGCTFTANEAGCTDGNACTDNDTCDGGLCQPGQVIFCNDNNPCTVETCHPTLGCQSNFATGACEDGDQCTINDLCDQGVCNAGPAPNCDDGNVCTDDGCDSGSGCTHLANTVACQTDGQPCTEDVCEDKVCVHNAIDDGQPCDDNQVCTTSETCLAGTCSGPVDKDSDGDLAVDNKCSGGTDCDDDDKDRFPGNPERCDDKDNNCQGGIDEICDKDNDDYCDAALVMPDGCTPDCEGAGCDLSLCPQTCKKGGADCDDSKGSINPGANELLELETTRTYFDGTRNLDSRLYDIMERGGVIHAAYWGTVTSGPSHKLILHAWSSDGGLTWTRETALHATLTRGRVAIAVQPDGRAVIAYHDPDNGDVRIVVQTATGWVDDVVATEGDVGHDLDIEVSPDGVIHVIHYDTGNGDLLHSYGAVGAWTTETVDGTGDVGQHASVAMDGAGTLHIAYFDASNSDLKYAVGTTGNFTTTTVDSAGAPGLHASIALGGGAVHIAHYELIGSDAKYTTNQGGAWASEVVETDGTIGIRPSIAVTAGGTVHMIYHSASTSKKRHASKQGAGAWTLQAYPKSDGNSSESRALVWPGDDQLRGYSYQSQAIWQSHFSGSWQTAQVDRTVELPYAHPSYVAGPFLDASGKLHAVTWNGSRNLLATASKGTDWQVNMNEYETNASWSSMDAALDAAGDYHICAHRGGVGLVYVTNASGAWVETSIDAGAAQIGANCRIRTDPNGKLHVVYWDAINSVYRYASDISGAWVLDVPDSKTASYGTAQMSVRADGRVDIVYPSSSFRHATNGAGSWAVQTVDPAPNSGRWPSVTRDAQGALHSVYLVPDSGSSDQGKLYYANTTSGAWTVELLDGAGNIRVSRTSIAMDADGKVHMTYTRSEHSYYATDKFGKWSIVQLGQSYSPWIQGMDRANDLAVTADGAVHFIAQHGWGSKYYGRYIYGNGVDDNCDGE